MYRGENNRTRSPLLKSLYFIGSSQPLSFVPSLQVPTTHSGPICHCRKACREINGDNKQGDASQTKYRKYYKSESTSDIGHFNYAAGWEMAHNSQCHLFSDPKWFQTFPPARLVHHSAFSSRALTSTLDCSGTRKLLISLRGARELRISGLHDVLPSLAGLKHNGLKGCTVLVYVD